MVAIRHQNLCPDSSRCGGDVGIWKRTPRARGRDNAEDAEDASKEVTGERRGGEVRVGWRGRGHEEEVVRGR